MMALNRYRLRHLARAGHQGARRANRLLERPDRLIGLILLGNNFVNIAASSLATVLALRLLGEAGIALAAGLLTLIILIFAEVAPKTFAALHPERVAFPAAHVLTWLLVVLQPLVAAVNWMANGVLRLLRLPPSGAHRDSLSREELRTVVAEAGGLIPRRHRQMLMSILDLEKVTVDDIMVPRQEINAIDLDDPPSEILEQIMHTQHTRVPLYRGDINEIEGILHLRRVIAPPREDGLAEYLRAQADEPYFIPAGTPLSAQLLNFQRLMSGSGSSSMSTVRSKDSPPWRICSRRSSGSSPPIRPITAPTSTPRPTARISSTAPRTCGSSIARCTGSFPPTAPGR